MPKRPAGAPGCSGGPPPRLLHARPLFLRARLLDFSMLDRCSSAGISCIRHGALTTRTAL